MLGRITLNALYAWRSGYLRAHARVSLGAGMARKAFVESRVNQILDSTRVVAKRRGPFASVITFGLISCVTAFAAGIGNSSSSKRGRRTCARGNDHRPCPHARWLASGECQSVLEYLGASKCPSRDKNKSEWPIYLHGFSRWSSSYNRKVGKA